MKESCRVWAFVVTLALCLPGLSQDRRATIDVGGISLALGTSQDATLSKLVKSSLEVKPLSRDYPPGQGSFGVWNGKLLIAVLHFHEGKLYRVNKTWMESEKSSDLARAFVEAAKKFITEGRTSCELEVTQSGPTELQDRTEFEARTVRILCGEKYLEVSFFRNGGRESAALDEWLTQ